MFFTNHDKNNFPTIIGKTITLFTSINAAENMRIDGRITGRISLEAGHNLILVVAATGKVTGEIHAPNVLVHGEVEGDVYARDILIDGVVKGNLHASGEVILMPQALVTGDIYYQRLSIRWGAEISGLVKVLHQPLLAGA